MQPNQIDNYLQSLTAHDLAGVVNALQVSVSPHRTHHIFSSKLTSETVRVTRPTVRIRWLPRINPNFLRLTVPRRERAWGEESKMGIEGELRNIES